MYRPLVWSGTLALLLLSAFFVVTINHTRNTAETTNTISFSGEGKVLAKPDVGVVDVSIVTDATTSKTAQDENSRKSKALTNFLKGQGVEEKDIKTIGYNIYPQYNYPQFSKPTITGYQVNQSVQIKIRDLEKVDSILDGVVTAGVNQVNNLQLTVDEPEKLMAEAREKAIESAKEKAGDLEDELDIDLGKIVNFSEGGNGYMPPIYYAKEMAADGRGGGSTLPSIPTAGENEIVVQVTLTYQIK